MCCGLPVNNGLGPNGFAYSSLCCSGCFGIGVRSLSDCNFGVSTLCSLLLLLFDLFGFRLGEQSVFGIFVLRGLFVLLFLLVLGLLLVGGDSCDNLGLRNLLLGHAFNLLFVSTDLGLSGFAPSVL